MASYYRIFPILFILMPNFLFGQLWDDYDGVNSLSYTLDAASGQWSETSNIFQCSTNSVTTPEHSFASYDMSQSIALWSLANSNDNEWIGWMDLNRTDVTGWGASVYSCGMVLAANSGTFNSSSTVGYAIGFQNSDNKLVVFRFSAGIVDGTIELPGTSSVVVASSYIYSDSDNGVNFYVHLESNGTWTIKWLAGAQLSISDAILSSSYSGGSVTSSSADNTYRGSSYKYSGWVYAHYYGSSEKAYFDNFGFSQSFGLPVELGTFAAKLRDNTVHLAWATATEANNYGFEIERQRDGNSDWETIGFITGHGTSNSPHDYSYEDVLAGVAFNAAVLNYRLRQIDRDGKSEYSPVVSVMRQVEQATTFYARYPNPFFSKLSLHFTLAQASRVTLLLTNTLGVVVRKIYDDELLPAGNHTSTADVGDVPPGMYIATLTTNGTTISRMLQKLQ